MIAFDDLTRLFSRRADAGCLEIEFYLAQDSKFRDCWMGKRVDAAAQREHYWFGLTADGQNAYDYPTLEEFLRAPVFDGKSLVQVWEQVTMFSVDGCDPDLWCAGRLACTGVSEPRP